MRYETVGAYAEAGQLLKRVLAIHEKVFGTEHPHTATSQDNLAALLRHRHRHQGHTALPTDTGDPRQGPPRRETNSQRTEQRRYTNWLVRMNSVYDPICH